MFQCIHGCNDKTYDNEEQVRQMIAEQKDMKIPTELIPRCPLCGEPMTTNLRCDDKFVQDEGWYAAYQRYEDYIDKHKTGHIVFLELGVCWNTPVIIKYPFWQMTANNPDALYICINNGDAYCPEEIAVQAVCVNGDIQKVLNLVLEK